MSGEEGSASVHAVGDCPVPGPGEMLVRTVNGTEIRRIDYIERSDDPRRPPKQVPTLYSNEQIQEIIGGPPMIITRPHRSDLFDRAVEFNLGRDAALGCGWQDH